MSIHVALQHITEYKYDRRVSLSPQVVRLRPAPHCRTRILSYSLNVSPNEHFINWQQDPQSNYLARLVFPEKTTALRIVVDLVAEMSVLNPFDFFLEPSHTHYPFEYADTHLRELAPYLIKQPATPLFRKYLEGISLEKRSTIDFLVEINQRLQKDVSYLIRLEPGVQTPEETLQKGSGSCRDSAWLMVNLLRHLGVAARFVSGYLIQLVADVKALDGPSGPEADFTDLHAWCEVYLPGAGWIGFDPTSGLMAGEGHIPLACSAEPGSASPITGAVDECEVTFAHHMHVQRVWETPRVTKPYTRAQWAAIDALGRHIDRDLQTHDVRLTQGGEPTFVSIDKRDAPEWNTTALGSHKRRIAGELVRKLKDEYAPQGLLHFGQGKWYPGEQLPRWSLNAFWRRDGQPIWNNAALFASETTDYGVTQECAAAFLAGVAQQLGLDARHTFPAYEDTWYYLWRERKLPVNVDPFDSKISDPLERARLRKVYDQGLDHVVGHVLPLEWEGATKGSADEQRNGAWRTGPWFLREERCYLVPGDSPLGYRLPLDSQPWVAKNEYPYLHPQDFSAEFPPLKPWQEIRQNLPGVIGFDARSGADWMTDTDPYAWDNSPPDTRRGIGSGIGNAGAANDTFTRDAHGQFARQPAAHESATWITRTALCA
ncbi:MAG: transglutaminase family protein, partial [Pseudomonadota bacterium]|nr:transglutaminase family protein [Pseudomonadota bacterium]